jgi:hypothetical protein
VTHRSASAARFTTYRNAAEYRAAKAAQEVADLEAELAKLNQPQGSFSAVRDRGMRREILQQKLRAAKAAHEQAQAGVARARRSF